MPEETVTTMAETVAETVAEPASSGSAPIDVDAILQKISEIISTYGIAVIAAILIFIIGRVVTKLVTMF